MTDDDAEGREPVLASDGARACSSCGNPQVAGTRFCDVCGTPAHPEAVRPAAPEYGPLLPELPIGEQQEPSGAAGQQLPTRDVSAIARASGGRSEFRGTVRHLLTPQAGGSPWLVVDVAAEDGTTFAIRAFFWIYLRAPYLSEGHYIRVRGRRTRKGYIKPGFIVNETTGNEWHRSRLPWFFGAMLIIAALVAVAVLL